MNNAEIRKGNESDQSGNVPDVQGQESKSDSKSAFIYCMSEYCKGNPIEAETKEFNSEIECPVCYSSLASTRLCQFSKCGHVMCPSCVVSCGKFKNGCPVCRRKVEMVLILDMPLKKFDNIVHGSHDLCLLNNPSIKKYYEKLNDHWKGLVSFVFRTKNPYSGENYLGIKGMDHLDLSRFERQDKLIKKTECFAVIKEDTGNESVIVACLLPNLSMRIVFSPYEDGNIEVENSYADEMAECLSVQLGTCWRILPRLIPRTKDVSHLFIRKFGQFTASLLLTGRDDNIIPIVHKTPMKKQLESMKRCNFDEKLFGRLRKLFPDLDLFKSRTPPGYDIRACKCHL